MKLAFIGATGFVGSAVLAEALMHPQLTVTGIVRNTQALPRHERLTPRACSVYDADLLTETLRGHDVLIHAFQPQRDSADVHAQVVAGHKAIIAAVKSAGIGRLVAVGGAASLKTPDGVEYLQSSLWDQAFDLYKPAILGTRALYYLLKDEKELDWVFISPSALLRPGERTMKFRYGKDDMLFDEHGHSRISLEDYAAAMVEEVLRPRHHRQRFTVGY
jgi:putative NADH-flavin reductase